MCLDQRLREAAVHRVDQQPRAAVAHAHRAAGGRNRPGAPDRLEQVGLARAHGDLVAAVELELELELEAGHARTLTYDSGRLEPKNSAWLIAARTVSSWNGLVTR